MTWLNAIEERSKKKTDTYMKANDDRIFMARVIRELVGYITFLEAYCSDRMSAEKARRRFQVPDDVKELLHG